MTLQTFSGRGMIPFHFCEWEGVTCGRKHRRVTVLDLQSRGLVGSLSPYIGNLSFIREIVLKNNTIGGKIPDEVGRLFRLIPHPSSYPVAFKLDVNQFTGSLPVSLANASELQYLRRSGDADEMDFFQSLANCSSLRILDLAYKSIGKGAIPSSLSSSRGIQVMDLSRNNLSGQIPNFLEKLSLKNLNLSFNEFSSFGSVYKGILGEDGTIVAVKVLNLQRRGASKSFISECEALKNILVHCDLKPSNILFDCDMTAHVGDFGLAKFLLELTNLKQSSSIGIRGTIGYTPQEYGLGNEVSTKGDVYSYGILLLEMITGKRPTNSVFEGGLNLHNYAGSALPNRVMEVVDPKLLNNIDEVIGNHSRSPTNRVEECLISMINVGVACSVELPQERWDISKAISELYLVRDILIGARI
uniref:non-specific serine/threonine protein kinase n=1 Tax=Fagus sylvatica TaxID=28930 RepID=A0A2N9FZR7_FAGSY